MSTQPTGAAADPAVEAQDVIVPPMMYLPTSGVPADGDQAGFAVELRETQDGRRALLAYTALDRLARCCGPDQPWVLYPTDKLGHLGIDYDVIYLDLEIPAELWHTSAAQT